jgi:hypothetical protein
VRNSNYDTTKMEDWSVNLRGSGIIFRRIEGGVRRQAWHMSLAFRE